MSSGQPIGSYIAYNRRDWLKEHSFIHDPFSERALRGEDDPVIHDAFVDILDFDEICGHLENPGPIFIFGHAGTGKSSLRRRIWRTCDDSLSELQQGKLRILPIEYIGHTDIAQSCTAYDHALQIVRLVDEELRSRKIEFSLQIATNSSPRRLLQDTFAQCKSAGILDGICVLVDNIDEVDQHPLQILNQVATFSGRSDLRRIPGYIFKFLISEKLLAASRRKLKMDGEIVHYLQWNEDLLLQALAQRLYACMDMKEAYPRLKEKPRDIIAIGMAELCSEELRTQIGDYIIDVGAKTQQPRTMWRLGYYLLAEHFRKAKGKRRIGELIELETFYDALKYLSANNTTETRIDNNNDASSSVVSGQVGTDATNVIIGHHNIQFYIDSGNLSQWAQSDNAGKSTLFTPEEKATIMNLTVHNLTGAAQEIAKKNKKLGLIWQRELYDLDECKRLGTINLADADVKRNRIQEQMLIYVEEHAH